MTSFLSRLFRGTALPRPDTELPTWTEIKAVLFPPFDAALNPMDMHRQGQMVWVEREPDEHGIRRIFEIRAMKGAGLQPVWGYSFDFVPHIAGTVVKWHRTEKTARADLWLGSGRRDDEMTYLYGIDELRRQIPGRLRRALANATDFWTPRPAISALPQLFERVARERESVGSAPSVELVPQIGIAHAFVLARNGHAREGEDMLRQVLGRIKADPDIQTEMAKRLHAAGT